MCKKCSMHKPPRAHHCRWCDSCILKFDHHCPWLNNCIGFYNHRYFFQFCCFMASGCFYAGTLGFREYQIGLLGEHKFSYLDGFFKPFDVLYTMGMSAFITYFIFIAALIISFLLMVLICWHGHMISRGMTSVERVLQQDFVEQCTQRGYVFVNPYDFGEFIRGVLLPSTHQPKGNGIVWSNDNIHVNLRSCRSSSLSSKRPVAFPPDVYLNYQSVIPPWENPPKPATIPSDLEPNIPSIETMDSKKDL